VTAIGEAAEPAAARLRGAGLRATAPRIAVLSVLLAAGEDHLTADEVLDRVAHQDRSIHRATVYRTLEQLRSDGLIAHVHLDRGVAAYHLTDPGRPARHLHAQCAECGVVVDLPPTALGRSAERVRAATGFELDLGHVALSGRCAACAARPPDDVSR
jgi:Fur family ferric uptake transcriptional regulator